MPGHVRNRGRRKDGPLKADGTRKLGSTRWQARWRPADDASDLNREEATFSTKQEALRWIAQRDADVLSGSYAPARKGAVLFETVLDDVRAKWDLALEPNTRAGYESVIAHWLIGDSDPLHPERPCRFRKLAVASVTTRMVQEFVSEVWTQRSPATGRRIFGVIKAVMDEAVLNRRIAINPCASVSLPSNKRRGVRRSHLYLEGPELRQLAEAMPEHWRLPVYIAGSCGLRAGELWALRRRDVDLLHDELTVRYALKEINTTVDALKTTKGLVVGPPKSAASRRRLSIASGLATMLRAALESPGIRSTNGYAVIRVTDEEQADLDWTDDANDPDRLLFVTPGGYPVRHRLLYKRIFRPTVVGRPAQPERQVRNGQGLRTIPARPAVPAALPARLHGLRWHDLRHTAAALSLAAPGGNLALVKERLGHENISTTADLYNKRVASVDASIAEAVGASIFDAAASEVSEIDPSRRARRS